MLRSKGSTSRMCRDAGQGAGAAPAIGSSRFASGSTPSKSLPLVLGLCVTLATPACERTPGTRADAGGAEVLVVGTIHGRHAGNPEYTYADIVHILATYDPDVIGVEIRPQDFRRVPYLKEMMLATVWGLLHDRSVYPIDWWDSENPAREARARLREQPEIIRKEQEYDSLLAVHPMIADFEARHGDFLRSNDKGYGFFNGQEYNEYETEVYRLSMQVFGDSPMNLMWETRNERMLDLIRSAASENPGRRLLVLTGSDHKHYFERALRNEPGVSLIEFESILPLDRGALDPEIRSFLEDADDLAYYAEGYPEDLDVYHWSKLTGLVHGPNMDWNPDIIPARNVEVAGKVLARWRDTGTDAPRLAFEAAWIGFLRDDCEGVLVELAALSRLVEEGAVESLFVRAYGYRNMGLCHDLLGNRGAALRSYARARELTRGTRLERNIERMLKDYESVPYRRARQP